MAGFVPAAMGVFTNNSSRFMIYELYVCVYQSLEF